MFLNFRYTLLTKHLSEFHNFSILWLLHILSLSLSSDIVEGFYRTQDIKSQLTAKTMSGTAFENICTSLRTPKLQVATPQKRICDFHCFQILYLFYHHYTINSFKTEPSELDWLQVYDMTH